MAYDVEAIRKKLKQSQSGKFTDPDEFKPAKAKDDNKEIKYRFFVLPPLMNGDILKSGEVEKDMDQFFIAHANHWVNDRPHPCPRVWNGEECPICQFGFDLLKENKSDQDVRSKIIRTWMPTTYYATNIYFTNWKGNPEELRGKVKWYNAPKTCFDKWTAALLREDAGDPEEPEAHGVFFDENNGFLFQLEVSRQGRQNSYKTSKFLANGGEGQPMVKDSEGAANKKALSALLKLRHNLWSKLETPDPVKVKKLFSVMVDGDDEDESGGFDEDETATKDDAEKKAKAEAKAEAKAKAAKKKAEEKKKAETEAEEDDDVDVVDQLEKAAADDEGDSLADETPLEEEPEAEEAGKTDAEKLAEESGDDDEGESDEIASLLEQLEDED